LGQRSRKRGRRERISAANAGTITADRATQVKKTSRSEERNAAVRSTLKPFEPGERPWSIRIGALVAAISGGAQLALFVFGVKLKVAGTEAKAGSTIVFGVLMFVCAAGMWWMRYWAVLGFMALLGITVTYFSLALVKASSLLGFAISIVGVGAGGFLFYKLVRVLSRIQMPRYTGR
jgi:hypothetical protein